MGLAEELKASQNKAPSEEAPPIIDPASMELLSNLAASGEPVIVPEGTEAAPEAAAEAAPKEEFIIGQQKFGSLEEAMQYAAKLESEKGQRDAYELGKQEAAQPLVEEAPAKPIEEQIQDMLFENPAEALKLYKEHIINQVKTEITTTTKADQDKQAAWNNFYEANPELLEQKEMVEFTLEKNWNKLGSLEAAEGLQQLALLTKDKLKAIAKSQLPETVLPSGAATVTASTGEATKVVQTQEKPLDFAEQVRRLGKRTLKV